MGLPHGQLLPNPKENLVENGGSHASIVRADALPTRRAELRRGDRDLLRGTGLERRGGERRLRDQQQPEQPGRDRAG